MTFEWARPDLNPRFVHVWHERQDLYLNQHPSYKGRTSVSVNQLKHGDVSLTLHKVKLSDEGTYRCYFPDSDKDSTVQLVVGVSSSPFVSLSGIDRSSSGVVLDCESRGWYPEPEVLWLDAEGNLLSAGPTETVRGPDDLYTVSSRVTVEKRHSNSFTCRVQQKNTNQTRETHITVPDDFFVAPCSSVVCISLVVSFTCVLAVVFAVWRWRRNKNKTMMADQRERQQLMAESEKRKEKQMAEIKLQRKEKEHGDMVGALMKQEEELKKQRDRLKEQQETMEKLVGDNEMKLESVEKDFTEKDEDKKIFSSPGCMKLKEIISVYKWCLTDRKRELDQLELDTERLLLMTKSRSISTTNVGRTTNKTTQSRDRRVGEWGGPVSSSAAGKRDIKHVYIIRLEPGEKHNIQTHQSMNHLHSESRRLPPPLDGQEPPGSQNQLNSDMKFPPDPVIAMVGEDVVLPCQLEPPADAFSMTMEWGRPDLDPRFVHVWHDGQELLSDKNDAYKGRTSLSISKLKRGDISLKLSTVKISDNGMYKCYIPKLSKEYFVELLVGAASSPAISLAGLHKASSGVVLDCESRGWYPEPEVLWLDAEGNLLSAGPTETVRGPDDLYTVSSRVTVEKRHSNSFTCRVQQKNTNQTRETHITVPEDFFVSPSSCTPCIAVSVVFGFIIVLAVVLLVWKWRQNKTDLKKELEEQREKLIIQQKEADKLVEENMKKVDSVERDEAEKEGDKTANKGQGFFKLKDIITETFWNLEEKKKELQLMDMNLDKLLKKLIDKINELKEKKKNVEDHMEQMKKEQEEIQRKPQS
ncbi:uncharacterized protein LOC129115721 [Anoplopoma fimbria]|uniref:uncharacterized protein LOC129115721 n=1 Tax=Anoplopoma fimbria TaxID=229290 RepID=UPI0023ECB35D|nr:uncharacterized protein LOC129115721 [Anoplopoma fimbria]